ncbi:hypothetical protein IW262DRAFT_882932 [Armillaria fumosa]|nr:hypothetical protein IW262DRAFT_882932 [Armillaria fumosa]
MLLWKSSFLLVSSIFDGVLIKARMGVFLVVPRPDERCHVYHCWLATLLFLPLYKNTTEEPPISRKLMLAPVGPPLFILY